ncbi:hypothetical protein LCGC14_2038010 [marine sediment metagenome]|uniref:Uncharacterized protein n=1 Tax=marine sediment metagenome TaxID=412755 RepID=A0A0F9ESX6_9ZZZZ
MELKATNREILDLGEGIGEFLEIEDLDVFFSWRLSSIAVVAEPKLKAFNETKRKLDAGYSEDNKDSKGKVVGQKVPPDKVNEWLEKTEVLLEAGVTFDNIGSIKLSELRKMSEEEGIPLSGKIIHLIRVVVVEDVDPVGGKEKKKPEEEKSRSARRTKAKEEKEE